MPNFFDLTQEDMAGYLEAQGEKKFRAQQLYRWVYGHGVHDFDSMTNLSKPFRTRLPELFDWYLPEVISTHRSHDGTIKFLFDVGEGNSVEAVLIPSSDRMTLCVSSEVGCNLGCKFCFTAKQKLKRRLHTSEIVGQFIRAAEALPEDLRISNIVFMGMGEPLDNPEAVFKSIDILHNPSGYNVSKKKITVSTSGIVSEIPRVTQAGVRLAVSLNGVNDQIRNKVMPINKKWPIDKLMEACREHVEISKDRVTFEYVLLRGVTDSLRDAVELHKLTQKVPSKINIIPFNEHPNSGFFRPDEETIDAFQQKLMNLGSHVLRRKTMGRDIYAACGQLTTIRDGHPEKMTV